MSIPATILVVDGHPFLRHSLCLLLAERSDWDVYEAENGEVALDRFRIKCHIPNYVRKGTHTFGQKREDMAMAGYDIFWHLYQRKPIRIATVLARAKVEQTLRTLEWVLPGHYFTRDVTTGEIVSGVNSAVPKEAWEDRDVHQAQETLRNEIARRAYELYLQRDCEHGRDVEDWIRAEKELTGKPAPVRTIFPQASRSTTN